uniref:Uncharacterized protein n=1 Tax=Panagrolaimus sp. PS1159 TaxID=55785 RepID=A0AC35FLX2_9BILA
MSVVVTFFVVFSFSLAVGNEAEIVGKDVIVVFIVIAGVGVIEGGGV